MITSRHPFWRTDPAGFSVTGYWPALTGTLAVLIGPVVLGATLVGLILAHLYWGAIHFVHPTAIGVGFKAPLP